MVRRVLDARLEDTPRAINVVLALLDDGVRCPGRPVARILHDGTLNELLGLEIRASAHLEHGPCLQEVHVLRAALDAGLEQRAGSVGRLDLHLQHAIGLP